MKKRAIAIAVAVGLSFATGMIVGASSQHSNPITTITAERASDPAFRDGLYQATLDAREGRRPHLAIGRWSTESARASYVAGYQEGYRQVMGSPMGSLDEASVAQLAASGFRDGMMDGAWHRAAAQPFQPDQTPRYRDAGVAQARSSADADVIKHFYREAYVHGYQQAYYSEAQ